MLRHSVASRDRGQDKKDSDSKTQCFGVESRKGHLLLSFANSNPTLAVTAAITTDQSTGVPFNVLMTAELTATTAVRIPEIVVFQLFIFCLSWLAFLQPLA